MRRTSKSIVVCCLLLLTAACSSSGGLAMKSPKAAAIPPGRSVALNVTSAADEDSRDAAHRMRVELFGRLVAEGVFRQVVAAGEAADYRMDVALGGVEEVSQGARIFFGVMAGSNELTAAVTLQDATTNAVVTSFDVSGESASHPLSSENGMDDAIREAASNIVRALQ
ncbi:MAG: DUF4410 domain-containing protein [Dongiaceae bacterium]